MDGLGDVDELSFKLGLASCHCSGLRDFSFATQLALLDAGATLAAVTTNDQRGRPALHLASPPIPRARPAFAMTINKSQTLKKVGVPEPVFAHGQLYVALLQPCRR